MNRNVALIFSEPEEEAEGLKRSNKGKGGSLSSPFMSVESLNTSTPLTVQEAKVNLAFSWNDSRRVLKD